MTKSIFVVVVYDEQFIAQSVLCAQANHNPRGRNELMKSNRAGNDTWQVCFGLLVPVSCVNALLLKGTPFEDGAGADSSKFQDAVKVADKLGERIARTTDKIMEMRKDIVGKQVVTSLLLLSCDSQLLACKVRYVTTIVDHELCG